MKKFGNAAHKAKVIISVFRSGERLPGREIAQRVRTMGYDVNDAHLQMFIYYNMLYKHLQKEDSNGTNRYFLI